MKPHLSPIRTLAQSPKKSPTSSKRAAIAVRPDRNGMLQQDPTDVAELAALLSYAVQPGVLDRWSAMAAHSVAEFTWPRVMDRFEAVLLEHAAPNIVPGPHPAD